MTELKRALERIVGKHTQTLTPEEKQTIKEAAQSDNKELRGLAAYVVHECLRRYECNVMARYGIKKGNQDFEDYINQMYVVIAEKLPRWDPDKANLSTYFVHYFNMTCVQMRALARPGTSTRYYENTGNHIEHAIEDLRKESNRDDITYQEIQAYIKMHYKEDISLETIYNYMAECKPNVCSLDALNEQENAWEAPNATFDGPETEILRKERSEEIKRAIDSLEPFYGKIIKLELSIMQALGRDKISNAMLCEYYQEQYRESVSPEWIKMIRNAAEREFQKRLQHLAIIDKAPIHNFERMEHFARKEDDEVFANAGEIFLYEESTTLRAMA